MQQQSALICICQFWEQLLWDECLALSVRETLLLIPQPENNSPLSKELWGIKAGTAVLQQASTKDGPAELLPVCLEDGNPSQSQTQSWQTSPEIH